ncbi:hypothetical protein F183_A43990 [Bryobacterales bacterium F-183]|nr:hypothetical protein F183_A43990 [Bryobacterales bacterium F-183]
MLFTDGNPTRTEDLRIFESNIYEVANVEGIDLDAKLKIAAEEIGDQIMAYLLQPGSGDPQAGSRRSLGLSTLVVTPAMRRWHSLHTLALIFRDAFHNQINGRYRETWAQYVSAAAEAKQTLFKIGLGFVSNPLARPAKPLVSSGAGLWDRGLFSVAVAWVDGAGKISAPSEVVTLEVTTGGNPVVAMSGPVPPTATGWIVYMAEAGGYGDLMQQNTTPVAVGEAWSPLSTVLLPGELPVSGQFADIYITASRLTPRG